MDEMNSLPRPVAYTVEEGGEIFPWEDQKHTLGNVVHAIFFEDGSVFDAFNGWRDCGRPPQSGGPLPHRWEARSLEHFDDLVANVAAVEHQDHPQWLDANRHGVERALAEMDAFRREAEPNGLPLTYVFLKHALRHRAEYLESH